MSDALSGVDCAVFAVDHDVFRKVKMERMKELTLSPVVVDCKNVFKETENIVYLGIGRGD